MLQVTQNYKTGAVALEDVDIPALKSGGVLVRTTYSMISSGTELMKVSEGKMNYLEKAKARPDQVKKVLQTVQQQGLISTYNKVMNKLDSATPLGYSTAGEVIAVGSGVEGLHVGQKVACAGAGYANHAEVNFIPKNLVVPIPDGVSMKHASIATVGAIALQGFRQSNMQLGETACVIGMGLLGQILLQILNAAGMKTIGVDLVEARLETARQQGASLALNPSDPELMQEIAALTGGQGVDCTFITAGGSSNGPAELAVEIARDRSMVVVIGKSKLDLDWKTYYEKELDIRYSRSYGPGRYDPTYEEKGIDYPIGYVRWTEQRNMSSFLELVAAGKVRLDPVISGVFPFSDAEKIYAQLADRSLQGLGFIYEYADRNFELPVSQERKVVSAEPPAKQDFCQIGVIGAGNYVSSMLLPQLQKNSHVKLVEVATATSLSALNAQKKFAFERKSTDYTKVLNGSDINTVLVGTQHGSHVKFVAEALESGKTVFVEKPLAISTDGVKKVVDTVASTGNDRLLVGFNRRFSPVLMDLKKKLANRKAPLAISYRVHAGQMGAGSWYLDTSQGSRFVGEAGHFFDVFAFLTDAEPTTVSAHSLSGDVGSQDFRENMVVTVEYSDGSVASLLYLTQGGVKVPKENLEVFYAGNTYVMDNFTSLHSYLGSKSAKIKRYKLDKGQQNEMQALVSACIEGSEMPISLESLFDTTLLTLAAEAARNEKTLINFKSWKQTVLDPHPVD